MRLRYQGTCRVCGATLPSKTEAMYERTTKTVRCITHNPPESTTAGESQSAYAPEEPIEAGIPGASARRKFERRSARREEQIRTAHPKIGGLIHALTEDPQSTRAWDVGAIGRSVWVSVSTNWPPISSESCMTAGYQALEPTSTTLQ